jgi:hypothetical protein
MEGCSLARKCFGRVSGQIGRMILSVDKAGTVDAEAHASRAVPETLDSR